MPPPVVGPKTAVALAAITYCEDPKTALNTYLPGWTIAWNGNVTDDGNYAFIATDMYQYNQVICIRGSLPPWDIFNNWDAFANWVIEDLNAIFTTSWPYSFTPGAVVSDGAMDGFNSVSGMADNNGTTIYSYLQQNAFAANKPITIIGHSLGGNLANVYASWLSWVLRNESLSNSLSLFTFAAPAAGNNVFAADLDSKIPRAWHYEILFDIVPKFPVFLELEAVSLLFPPSPDSGQIYVEYKGWKLSLREAIIVLAFTFYEQGYLQPSNNYTILNNALDPDHIANALDDWMKQAGYQHAVSNYCALLGVKEIKCKTVGTEISEGVIEAIVD